MVWFSRNFFSRETIFCGILRKQFSLKVFFAKFREKICEWRTLETSIPTSWLVLDLSNFFTFIVLLHVCIKKERKRKIRKNLIGEKNFKFLKLDVFFKVYSAKKKTVVNYLKYVRCLHNSSLVITITFFSVYSGAQ